MKVEGTEKDNECFNRERIHGDEPTEGDDFIPNEMYLDKFDADEENQM